MPMHIIRCGLLLLRSMLRVCVSVSLCVCLSESHKPCNNDHARLQDIFLWRGANLGTITPIFSVTRRQLSRAVVEQMTASLLNVSVIQKGRF